MEFRFVIEAEKSIKKTPEILSLLLTIIHPHTLLTTDFIRKCFPLKVKSMVWKYESMFRLSSFQYIPGGDLYCLNNRIHKYDTFSLHDILKSFMLNSWKWGDLKMVYELIKADKTSSKEKCTCSSSSSTTARLLCSKCAIFKDKLALTTYTHMRAALQKHSILLPPFTEILKAMHCQWRFNNSAFCQIMSTLNYHLINKWNPDPCHCRIWLSGLLFFAGSKSQSALWNAITAGMGIKGKEQKPPLNDPRSPEEILADDLPAADEPDATEKTAIRFAASAKKRKSYSLLVVNYHGVNSASGCSGTSTALSSSLSGVISIQSIFLSVCRKETKHQASVCFLYSFCIFGLWLMWTLLLSWQDLK